MKIFILLILLTPSIIFSQEIEEDHIEYKKVYLDQFAFPTDSANSVYYAYNLLVNNVETLPFGKIRTKKYSEPKYSTTNSGRPTIKGIPRLLSDTICIYNKKNQIQVKEIYEKGRPLILYGYWRLKKKNIVNQYTDFTKAYNNEIGSYYHEYGYKEPHIHKGYYKNQKRIDKLPN